MKLTFCSKENIEVIPRCTKCNDDMTNETCIECHERILNSHEEKPYEFYCFGSIGETWHLCQKCKQFLDNLKCSKCGNDNIDRWGVDLPKGEKVIRNRCKNCDHKWDEGNRK